MQVRVLFQSARSVTLELADGGRYETKKEYDLYVNGVFAKKVGTVVTSLFGLKPETQYLVEVRDGQEKISDIYFVTDREFITINVRDFGAKGDGETNDTQFLQAAILACPPQSRVLIPKGIYRITSLFLKSNCRIELEKGAELRAIPDRELYPIFPGMIQSYDETEEYNLGTWEGNPLPMFSGVITGIHVDNVLLYGEGTINGFASKQDWWDRPKVMRGAFRPRLFFLSHSSHVTLQGLKFCNSPSWTLHPYFSDDLGFYSLTIENPSDSPNTDGLDPESCKNVDIAGVRFSLGDDCIAVKSGKIYMGRKHKKPSENIRIRQCLMENGHGAVTVGSEMAGGVKYLVVEECRFSNTDRGLRVKTRRGRGKDAIIDQIIFRDITMEGVMTPFVVNAFYFCDPDGKTEYVQSRAPQPVDQRTPQIRRLEFRNIDAGDCHVAAAYFEGLPEQKIQEIEMENVQVSFAEHPKKDVPAMSSGVEPCSLRGMYAGNVEKLVLKNVKICGQEGKDITCEGVDMILQE